MNESISPNFDAAFLKIVGIEGHYSDDPNDAGGETMFGITVATARAFGYTGPMRDMPLGVAQRIYRRGWWDLMRLDDVCNVAGARIAFELFECAVNIRPLTAVKFLQRALNSFNQRGVHYPDVTADGDLGPRTLSALAAYMRKRQGQDGERVLLDALNSQQGVYYLERGEVRPANEDFTFGWFAHRVRIS